MKKFVYLFICLMIVLTGCAKEEKNDNNTNNNNTNNPNTNINGALPKHHLYYVETTGNINKIIDIDVASGQKSTLVDTTKTISTLRFDKGKVYALFSSRIGYVENSKIKFITPMGEQVSKYIVKNNNIYYGKNNEGTEQLTLMNINTKNEKTINEVGINQLVIDDYIYYRANNGTDMLNLIRFKLDGTGKQVIYDKIINQLIKTNEYLYFIDSRDNSSIYKMKNDGTDVEKVLDGPFAFENYKSNQIDGYTNMGVIDTNLFYINSNDNNKLYKTDGSVNEKVIDSPVSNINVIGDYIYFSYQDNSKPGIYLLDKTGKELLKVTDVSYVDYLVSQ